MLFLLASVCAGTCPAQVACRAAPAAAAATVIGVLALLTAASVLHQLIDVALQHRRIMLLLLLLVLLCGWPVDVLIISSCISLYELLQTCCLQVLFVSPAAATAPTTTGVTVVALAPTHQLCHHSINYCLQEQVTTFIRCPEAHGNHAWLDTQPEINMKYSSVGKAFAA